MSAEDRDFSGPDEMAQGALLGSPDKAYPSLLPPSEKKMSNPQGLEETVLEEKEPPGLLQELMDKNKGPGSVNNEQTSFLESAIFKPKGLSLLKPPLTLTQRTANSYASLAGLG